MPAAEHGMAEEPIRLFPEQLERELWKHPGKWAAIAGVELIAVGESPDEVLDEAERKGFARRDFVLEHLPEPGKLYVF